MLNPNLQQILVSFVADQTGLKQTRLTIPENTFLRDGAPIKCKITIMKIAQETAVVVPVWRL